MATESSDHWNPDFYTLSPLFFPLQPLAISLSSKRQRWPDLEDYQMLFTKVANPPRSLAGQDIRFVAQSAKPSNWIDGYEPRIYLKGEVQTRLKNWHDFFQTLVWAIFPKTKSMLNAKHYEAIRQRMESGQANIQINNKSNRQSNKQRTPLENALTQFDECGAIIASADKNLLQQIREFRWKELFWYNRSRLRTELQCFVFGHAIYEKALHPYLGLTAHAVLLMVGEDFFHWPLAAQLQYLDNVTAEEFEKHNYPNPKRFHPFPLLGMPDWDENNNKEYYYNNTDYFRPGRSGMKKRKIHPN